MWEVVKTTLKFRGYMKEGRVPTDEPLVVYLIVLFLCLSVHLNYQTVPNYMAYYLTVPIYTAQYHVITTYIAYYQAVPIYTAHYKAVTTHRAQYQAVSIYIYIYIYRVSQEERT